MGRYAWIKSQTNVAISWLIETANAHGNNVRPSSHSNPSDGLAPVDKGDAAAAKQGRLKGKARKEAKKAQQTKNASATGSNDTKPDSPYKVTTEEILKQAAYLRTLGETIVMPKNVWRAFKEAVRGRQQYAEKFAEEQPGHKDNEGHVYFLEVLRQLIETLGQFVLVQSECSNRTETQADSCISLSNMFQSLNTDDADNDESENFDTSSEETLSEDAPTAAPSGRYEPKIDLNEEARLIWFCFVDDVKEISGFVVLMWTKYFQKADDAPDLVTATLLSEAALELISKLEEEMRAKVVVNPLEVAKAWTFTMGTLTAVESATRDHGQYPLSVKDITKRYSNGAYGSYVKVDSLLVQCLIELPLELVVRGKGWQFNGPPFNYKTSISGASLDILSCALVKVACGAKFGINSVAAGHILQTTWLKAGADIQKPFNELHKLVDATCTAFEDYYQKDIRLPEKLSDVIEELRTLTAWAAQWPGQWERYMLLRHIDANHPVSALTGLHRDLWKDFDVPLHAKETMYDRLESHPDPAGHPEARKEYEENFIMPPKDMNFLRKNNPVMSGMLAVNMLFLRTELHLGFANMEHQLFAMCHLYNALRQLGYLDQTWEALENVIDMHLKTIFLGDRPAGSAQTIMNRALLAFGYPPEILRSQASASKGREKNPSSLTHKRSKKTGELVLPPMMAIVGDYLHDRNHLRLMIHRMDMEMAAQAAWKPQQQAGIKRKSIKSFIDDRGPIAFLEELRSHVEQFDRYFTTDCIALTRTCEALFGKMETEEMLRLYKAADIEEGGFSITTLTLSELACASRQVTKNKVVPEVPVAVKAAAVLREYIQAGAIDIRG